MFIDPELDKPKNTNGWRIAVVIELLTFIGMMIGCVVFGQQGDAVATISMFLVFTLTPIYMAVIAQCVNTIWVIENVNVMKFGENWRDKL